MVEVKYHPMVVSRKVTGKLCGRQDFSKAQIIIEIEIAYSRDCFWLYSGPQKMEFLRKLCRGASGKVENLTHRDDFLQENQHDLRSVRVIKDDKECRSFASYDEFWEAITK